jgi:Tfp pilus assembly protein PilX
MIRHIASRLKNRRGFALPLAILVIAALTATLAAAFSSVASEIATNSAQRSESRAFALAESGLEEFIARRQYHCTARTGYTPNCASPPYADVESVTVSLSGGYANVVAERVRRAIGITQPAMYLIRSQGVDTVAPFNGATRSVYGERIVAQYVTWNAQNIQVLSGWTSLTGLNKNGGSGRLWGADHCALAGGGGAPTVAGISVPNVPGATGSTAPMVGSPPIQTLGTQAQANAAVKIDWNAIVNGGQVSADYTFPYSSNAPAALVTDWNNPNIYPVIHVTGNGTWTVPGGRGLLIIDGNGVMSGNTQWEGIIMAGGTFTSNGTTDIFGAVVSGLNMKLTPAQLTALLGPSATYPGQSDVGNGTKDIEYDSCEVMKAASRFGYFKAMPNAWMDNFTTY